MSGFVGDPSSASMSSWREQQLARELPPAIPQHHQEPHHSHLQQHHQQPYSSHPHTQNHHTQGGYDRYSPSVGSEGDGYREWSASAGHEGHSPNQSPHSHTSGSLIGSPHSHPSSHNSIPRRDSEMSINGGVSGEHRMSIGERRQEKRKNKRHRLTHNETRFLMSEFARQAHPDAAHRERLAREIPGLTPRQVQVWFQNRRAKLKRMSSDDRERMMKSRALPDEFPILQTLQYGPRMMGTPLGSPTDYSPTPNMGFRPDHLGRRRQLEEEVGVSPTNNAFASLSFPPSTSSGDLLSPVSVSNERPGYLPFVTAPLGPPQRGNPFSRPTDYRHPSVPRLQLHDVPRSVSEPQSTPVRPSQPYSNGSLDNGEYQLSPGYSMQAFVEPPRSVPPEGTQSPFGQAQAQQNTYAQPYPSPSPASAPLRPPPFSSPLGLGEYKYPQAPMTPHSATISNFSNGGMSHNPEFQIPQLSAPPDATAFGSSYLTRNSSGSNSVTSAPNSAQEEEKARITGREIGHQRKRSSSHPPSFPQAARA